MSEEARRRGIGAVLLVRCVQAYWQLDYTRLFGEFGTEHALGPYCTRQGFTVLRPGQGIDVGTLLTGMPLHLGAGPGLTFFHRRQPQDSDGCTGDESCRSASARATIRPYGRVTT
ncbi:hypothetical protein [Streptomyces sp. NPDC004270]